MSATEQTPKGLKILVVDDDPFLLRLYRLKLSRWSISPNVRVARSGSEALIRIGEQRPDMLITDLFMSDMRIPTNVTDRTDERDRWGSADAWCSNCTLIGHDGEAQGCP